MDMIDGIIVGAAAAAIGTIVAYKYLQQSGLSGRNVGGDIPRFGAAQGNPNYGVVYVENPPKLSSSVPPIVQNTPITEAAYNQQPITYVPAFGLDTNNTDQEALYA